MRFNSTYRVLSPSEEWYVSRYEENENEGKLNIIPIAVDVGSLIPKKWIERVIEIIISRNEILHTEYAKSNKTVARIHKAALYLENKYLIEHAYSDLTNCVKIFEKECLKGLDIYEKTYRFIIYEDTIKKSRMILMIFHRLIFDWVSIYLLYNQFRDVLKHLSLSTPISEIGAYSDYVYSMQLKLTRKKRQKNHTYWQQVLSEDLATIFKPNEKINPEKKGVFTFELNDVQKVALKQMTKEYRCSEFIILLAIIGFTVQRITNKTHFTIHTPYSNRYIECKQPTIGVMLYAAVLKFCVASFESIENCIKKLKQSITQSFHHQPVNFNYLQKIAHENNNELQLFYNHQFHQSAAAADSSCLGVKAISLFEKKDLIKPISPFAMETFACDDVFTIRISYQKRYVNEVFLRVFKETFISYIALQTQKNAS